MNWCVGTGIPCSWPKRTTAPFQYSSSVGLPSLMSRCIEVVPSGDSVSKMPIVSVIIVGGSGICLDVLADT